MKRILFALWFVMSIGGCIMSPNITPTNPALLSLLETHTPFPENTLVLEERINAIKNLMETNAGCNLPCFWGVIPGVTDWKTAERFLYSIGGTIGYLEVKPQTNYHSIIFKDENLTAGDNFGFLETLGIVETIFASGNLYGSNVRSVEDFTNLWVSYSPKEVISKYGIPSRVLLSSVFAPDFGNTGTHGYILWVFYDHLGFMIRYDGAVDDLPIYHICPHFQENNNITRLDLIMQNPLNPFPLEEHDSILGTQTVPRIILPIEDAAGISIEEFYNLFVGENGQPCFDTPRDIWKIN